MLLRINHLSRDRMHSAELGQFTNIDTASYPDKLAALLANNLDTVNQLLTTTHEFTWDALMYPLEVLEDAVARFWSPISHLHGVMDSPELRTCYEICLDKLSAYESAIGQNEGLYKAIQSIDVTRLDATQAKIIKDTLLDFKLSGVNLSKDNKRRFESISTRLSQLSTEFSNHVLDAVEAFSCLIDDEARLAGLPWHVVSRARELAEEKQLQGWLLTLDAPCYVAVITYADDRLLREELYYAYLTRASELGPHAGQFDNSVIMGQLLELRHEQACLLGFANYAELSLATKMADSPTFVVNFLMDLSEKVKQQARHELASLQAFAHDNYALDQIEPWDISYFSQKKKQALYHISEEELRVYFPLTQVMKGLWEIIHRLYGVHFEPMDGVTLWHPDASAYRLIDEQGDTGGYLLVDLFARPGKRGGAWMDSCQSRFKHQDGAIQRPIATLTCNFSKASQENSSPLLTHDEMITLFHEMGHCLHHLLTQVDYLSASGINGVEWDAVELPSQLFENWCWESSAISLLSAHVDSGEPIPDEVFSQLRATKHFQSALIMLRQLEFALFDCLIHMEINPTQPDFIQATLSSVRKQISITPVASYNRVQHSFSHVFAGGYSAGYYSYLWAEVLSSDAFARFEEEGVFNPKTGRDFLQSVLQVGSSFSAKHAFERFRGRAANMDALLRHHGIGV